MASDHLGEPDLPIRPDEGRLEPSLVPTGPGPLVQRLVPKRFVEPFHVHPSVEINFLDGVRFTHVFSGLDLPLPEGRLILFWGAVPHRARAVSGEGAVINAYLSLTQFTEIAPPGPLVTALLRGDVIAARDHGAADRAMLTRFLSDAAVSGEALGEASCAASGVASRAASRAASGVASGLASGQDWGQLHLKELAARLARLALEGWEVLHRAGQGEVHDPAPQGGAAHVQRMMQVLSRRYADTVTMAEVAASAGISPGHASAIFRAFVGTTPSAYLTALRLSHARAMLAATDESVARVAHDCGFGSMSRFYEAFVQAEGCAPGEWRRQRR